MRKPFDPYHKWLGISPKDQPANHYRLLGIDLFESDPDVISSAADQRMTHVRAFQTGEHSVLSQKILNEIAAARVCLLNLERRTRYEQQLRVELASIERERTGSTTGAVDREPTILSPPPTPPSPPPSPPPHTGQPCVSPPSSFGAVQPAATAPAPPAVSSPPCQLVETPVMMRPDSPSARLRRSNKQRWEAVAAIAIVLAIGIGSMAVLRSGNGWQGSASQENGNPDRSKQAPNPTPEPSSGREPGTDPGDKKPEVPEIPSTPSGTPSGTPSELSGTLNKARDAIAVRDLATARNFVQAAEDISKSRDELQEAARVRMLLEAHEIFWNAVRSATDRLREGVELKLNGTPIGNVIDVQGNELTIRWRGENLSCVMDENEPPKELPWELAVALAERVVLIEGNTTTDLAIGAFLAVDHRGDREEAGRRLERSGKQGKELMPELELAGEIRSHRPTRELSRLLLPAEGRDDRPVEKWDSPVKEEEKPPIPDRDALEKAEKKIAEFIGRVKKTRNRQARVDRLLAAAAKANSDPAEQFVLYRHAVDMAVKVGDPYEISKAIEEMQRSYLIDALGMKAEKFWRAYRSKEGAPHREQLVRECERLLSTAMAANDYRAADKAVRVAISGARARKDLRRLVQLEDKKKLIESLLPDHPTPTDD